ncbi:hypothetical protein AB7303_19960 [Providencia rettgeri]
MEDAGDLAIAGGDYVLDGAAAVTTCATASNYCQKALNDLEGKHQGALDVATSLINGDSWNAIQDLAKRAGEGDQLAAEQLGAAMAGIFIPGKKVPTPATGGKIPGKLPEGSNWTAGEGAFSPNNGKGTITDVVKDDAKYDGNSLPYGKDGLDKGTTGQINNGLEWNSWQNYPKATVDGKQYAQVGDRLYSQHAVDRMQPSGLGSPAGTVGAGRNISPGIVEYAINNGSKTTTSVNGVERVVYWSGEVGVVTENNAKVIVTILRRSEK